jgi:hypothetical protein
MANNIIQELRSHGWDALLQKVISFCNTNWIEVLVMEDNYVPYGRSSRFSRRQTNDDHFRSKVYLGIVDQIFKSLIIGLMRSIWSCFLVCWHWVPSTHLLLLMHTRYANLLISTPMILKPKIWYTLNYNLITILMTW